MTDGLQQQCAAGLMDTFHMMMRTIRPEARKHPPCDPSMQQFRAMKTIERHEGASLSLVSEHLGATLSATSKLVDGLVERGWIRRGNAQDDRRRLILTLTEVGVQVLESVHLQVISTLAGKLSSLSPGECAMINLAMDSLRTALVSSQQGEEL